MYSTEGEFRFEAAWGDPTMTTYVIRAGKLVNKDRAPPSMRHGAAPYVISDEMPETRHMANSKMYTSKAKFREATRANNCVEVGNDPAILRPRKPVVMSREQRRDSIRQAIRELQGGRR